MFHRVIRALIPVTGMVCLCVSQSFAAQGPATLRGVFFDFPVQGLRYEASPSGLYGLTETDGGFHYRDGDRLTFRLGDLVLGTTAGKSWLTPQDLVPAAKGDVHVPRLNNIGMLIQSLDRNGNIEDGIELTSVAHEVVRTSAVKLDLDTPSEELFKIIEGTLLPEMTKRGAFVPVTGGVMKNTDEKGSHYARTPEMARNQLRRTAAGIMRLTDVKIPLRDYDAVRNPEAYLLGTLHRPVGPQVPTKVPVVLNVGVYGKDKIFGSLCSREQLQIQEKVDDRYRSGNPDHKPYENHESVDTFVWVPHGYAVLRVDEAGIGRSPGVLRPWSRQGALNYVDTIEWSGTQSWSNGNVGTNGISYYAMTQWMMSQYLPKSTHLKAMIPWEGGTDLYLDDWYTGGLFTTSFIRMWSFGNSRNNCSGKAPSTEFAQRWIDNPTNEPEVWDEHRTDFSKVTVPFLSAAGIDNMTFHPRGNLMGFRFAKSAHRLLRVQTGSHLTPFYSLPGVADQLAFFDFWLKGIDNGIMSKPRIKLAVRTGDERGSYWAYAHEWPLPHTQYTKFYLDARPEAALKVDGTMPVYQLHPSSDVVTAKKSWSTSAPTEQASATYSAQVKPITQVAGPPPPKFVRPQACDTYGISFATPPLAETITLAGYAKLVTWVSSTTEDMDIHASLRVYDKKGKQVVYATEEEHRIDLPEKPPIQMGRLKVSHRKLDAEHSTFFQPVHTHLARDVQKLQPDQIVQVDVEFWPLTAEIKKGHRVVVDVQPYHGCGHAWPHEYGNYNSGMNTVHTGPGRESYLQLPIVTGLKTDKRLDWTAAAK